MPTLKTSHQVDLDKRAVRIWKMSELEPYKKQAKELYLAHLLSQTPEGKKGVSGVLNAISLAAVQFAMTEDLSDPQIMWACSAAHRWGDFDVPPSGFSNGNPDNVYRIAGIDSAASYEITGKRFGRGPIQTVFMLFSAVPGSEDINIKNQEGAPVNATLTGNDLKYGPDGSFSITISTDPRADGAPHLQIKPDTKLLMIRDIMADWDTQYPNHLGLRRVSGGVSPPRADDEIARRAGELLIAEVKFWLRFFDENNYTRPPNTPETVHGRNGGWGYAMSNSYRLNDDEAFVVTLDPLGAAYLGFQLSDTWGITRDYINRTSSLNSFQAKPNRDGTYTYVVTPKDPGVWNWLDTEGGSMGMWTLRWQNMPPSVTSPDGALRQMEVIKIGDLKKRLPGETIWVNSAVRAKQLSDRAASYNLRLQN
jgi:hypothetical protein